MSDRTHHAECWRYHSVCAIAEIERLRAELVEEQTGRGLLARAHDNHMAALTEVARLRAATRGLAMKPRTIQDLAELLVRIDKHRDARNVGAGGGTIYEYSRVYRWLASWTRRRELVARALACELGLLGIRRDMIPDPCRCCGRPLRGGRCPSVLSPEADPTEVTE